MNKQISKNHHFVPQFLMRPWCADHGEMHVYYWDKFKGCLRLKSRSPKSVCFQVGLLSLSWHPLGPDAIEKHFFGPVDSAGCRARDTLTTFGARSLNAEERTRFVELLLSLEARRPQTVEKLRKEGANFLSRLDKDPEIAAKMKELGVMETPSAYLMRAIKFEPEDLMLHNIPSLVVNSSAVEKLFNASWDLVRLSESDGEFLLSDRPLVRIHGYDSPDAVWFIPLTPSVGFLAANHRENLRRLKEFTPQRLAKIANLDIVLQAERFVFAKTNRLEAFIRSHINRN